jgi:Peroxidase
MDKLMIFLVLVLINYCNVQGCDASVLLDGSASGPGEQQAPPNLTLRAAAFKAINEIRALIDKACGRVVSCADVVAIAARDSVALVYISLCLSVSLSLFQYICTKTEFRTQLTS